ncbi:hypothetical protein TNCV_4470671 [Trichonephila clavipes]|uniref:Uncharacterized protein n=1 Tax=Trichonephila clavipes TaxID=2585209 RepID=A0A8X6SDB4_TRICX|nr:hypothetical protein TNCV_4470671 [Trichonephila clavipes]
MWFAHFRHGQRVRNMNRYMNAELADIYFVYGYRRVAVQLYGERYPSRWQPNHLTFARVHQKLAEPESFKATTHTHTSILKWTWWHIYPTLLLRSVKPPVFSNVSTSANPCRVGVAHAYMPIAAIPNASCDALMSYF